MKNCIDDILGRIEAAKKRSGRETEEILLVAVTKTQTSEKVLEAQKCGLNTFGENKVQELIDKYPEINQARWHFIGHLQKNKVKYIIDKVDLIHSVDGIELAKEIDKRALAAGIKMRVLVQVNIGKEESKSGIYEENVDNFMEELRSFQNIIVSGLMTVPPICSDEAVARNYFSRMKSLFTKVKKLNYDNFDVKYLSMGMTDDFEIAIEEGANIVRVGSGIFGKRVYKEE